jgi:hypothetical protein
MAWSDKNPVIAIGGSALIALIALYFLWRAIRRQPARQSSGNDNKDDKKPENNTEIEDEVLGTVYDNINWGDNPPGYPILDNGKYYYYMRRPRGIKFKPNDDGTMPDYSQYSLNLPLTMGILPEYLWRATHRPQQLVPILFELPPPEWIKEIMKYAVMALALGVLVFIVAKGKT